MTVLPVIESRFSSRDFISKKIDNDILDNIIEAGRLAPSAKNRQPWRFVVISEKSVKDVLNEACYGAEVIEKSDTVIAVCTTNINYIMPNGQPAHLCDLTFATSFMLLQAEHEGLGSCIVTTYNEEIIKEVLTVPFSMRVVCLIALGYKDEIPEIKKERKAHSDIHNKEHW